ncbi:hypothetical protein F5X96DRAFT_674957 [Biscogniauxia mediterranea]|nr:hypothetical protein F5X96DRAFT_674957 [Biscogniauxia mediterranea]
MSLELEIEDVTERLQSFAPSFNLYDDLLVGDIVTPEQVEDASARLASRILDNYKKLSSIVRQYEAKIQTRWIKKSKLKRRQTILKAWPQIPTHHRPDVRDWRKSIEPEPASYKWPHMNLEDLAKKEPLLLMLNSRGHRPPLDFCSADLASARFGIAKEVIVVPNLPDHIMTFSDDQLPMSYGKLQRCEGPKRFMPGSGCYPGDGLLVLEIQDKIYEFLVDCCKHILHDFAEELLFSDSKETHGGHCGGELNLTTHSHMAETLATFNFEIPYCAPAKPDMDEMVEVLSAELAKTKDHLCQLRTSPGYFQHHLLEQKRYLEWPLKYMSALPNVFFKRMNCGPKWGTVATRLLIYSIKAVYYMTYINERVVKLRELIDAHSTQISPGVPLPTEVATAVGDLYIHVKIYTRRLFSELSYVIPGSPPLKPYFDLFSDDDGKVWEWRLNPNTLESSVKDVIYNVAFLIPRYDREVINRVLITEFGLQLERDRTVRSYVSEASAKLVAEYGVLARCLEQLEAFTHMDARFNTMDSIIEENEAAIVASAHKSLTSLQRIQLNDYANYSHLVDPSGGRFHYPERRARTKENVEAMRRAEDNLEAVWLAAIKTLRAEEEALIQKVERILVGIDIQRTKPWEEPPPRSQENTKPRPAQAQALAHNAAPFGGLFPQDHGAQQQQQPAKPTLPAKKRKIKTRGNPAPRPRTPEAAAAVPDPQPDPLPQQRQQQQKICKVSRRALKVFRVLFHDPEASAARPGEVPWAEYLHALTSVGFSASKQGGGSRWLFQPPPAPTPPEQPQQDDGNDGGNNDDDNGKWLWASSRRSITFHEPHPSSRIEYRLARKFGRRLQRTYGWSGEMFVLDE